MLLLQPERQWLLLTVLGINRASPGFAELLLSKDLAKCGCTGNAEELAQVLLSSSFCLCQCCAVRLGPVGAEKGWRGWKQFGGISIDLCTYPTKNKTRD